MSYHHYLPRLFTLKRDNECVLPSYLVQESVVSVVTVVEVARSPLHQVGISVRSIFFGSVL